MLFRALVPEDADALAGLLAGYVRALRHDSPGPPIDPAGHTALQTPPYTSRPAVREPTEGEKRGRIRMIYRNPEGALTDEEKSIVKALLAKGQRNQDIQALLNIGRPATVNSARITEVKQNDAIVPASDAEVEFFRIRRSSHDPKTGLNLIDNERLIRAREAMILAVQVFNSAGLNFKTEVFAVLANIAWTYLLHEYYGRKNEEITGDDGRSILLSQMIKKNDCPLSAGIRKNLNSMKMIRDDVEHQLLGKSDIRWLPIFQACCLNFDKAICQMFGNELSLQHELSFALQFAKPTIDELAIVQEYAVPANIEALDARLREGMTEEDLADLEYQFRVVYTLDSASKSKAHIQFLHPGSEQAEQVRNVLVKYKTADELHPFKPKQVIKLVVDRSKLSFTSNNHTQAWHLHKVRPKKGAKQPDQTNKDFCIYHAAHGDYTYSEKWVDFLVAEIVDDEKWQAIRNFRR